MDAEIDQNLNLYQKMINRTPNKRGGSLVMQMPYAQNNQFFESQADKDKRLFDERQEKRRQQDIAMGGGSSSSRSGSVSMQGGNNQSNW